MSAGEQPKKVPWYLKPWHLIYGIYKLLTENKQL
jgi:hypothetical protein